jgi:hypothetical protein
LFGLLPRLPIIATVSSRMRPAASDSSIRAAIGKPTAPGPALATGDRNGLVNVRAAVEVIEDGFR